jgi:molybdopterin-guanine dinucleotide biosynthesis protein A
MQVTDRITVVGAQRQEFGDALLGQARLIHDSEPGEGPLAALHDALRIVATDVAIWVGCDMPFLSPEILQLQLELLGLHEAVIPYAGAHAQPLHGVYRTACASAAKRLLGRGDRSLQSFLNALDVRYLCEAEWHSLCPDGSSFLNINTQGDLARATRIAQASS